MMTIYKVTYDKLTYDRGIYDGTVTLGYYVNRKTAEKVAAEHPDGFTNRAAKVVEVEVNEE